MILSAVFMFRNQYKDSHSPLYSGVSVSVSISQIESRSHPRPKYLYSIRVSEVLAVQVQQR
jgi:hypothetical protein